MVVQFNIAPHVPAVHEYADAYNLNTENGYLFSNVCELQVIGRLKNEWPILALVHFALYTPA